MNGKGYIALLLCAAAIGISGYMFYQHQHAEPARADSHVEAQKGDSGNVEAVATKPAEIVLPTETEQKKALKTAAPLEGENVAEYAVDCLSYNATTRDWRTHNGVDLAAEAGTAVKAAAEGTVYTVYEDDAMGMTVVLRHQDGYSTKYQSLAEEVTVKPGDTVALGQKIGTVGNTALLESALGDHLHFSVSCNNEPVNPADFLALS